MSRAWMPLYVGDYLADTKHLTTEQHGAYFLLIMHYWHHGGLPADRTTLKTICGLGPNRDGENRWRSICLALAPFFDAEWRHKRIDKELQKSNEIRAKREYAGRKGGQVSRGKGNVQRFTDQANAKQAGHQSHKLNSYSSFVTPASTEMEADLTLPPETHSTQPPRQNGHASPTLTALVKAKGWAP